MTMRRKEEFLIGMGIFSNSEYKSLNNLVQKQSGNHFKVGF